MRGFGARAVAAVAQQWSYAFYFDIGYVFTYTYRFVRGNFVPVVEGEGLLLRNVGLGTGRGERPEWGASPAKPSKPLRLTRCHVVRSGFFVEYLVGPPGSLLTLSVE